MCTQLLLSIFIYTLSIFRLYLSIPKDSIARANPKTFELIQASFLHSVLKMSTRLNKIFYQKIWVNFHLILIPYNLILNPNQNPNLNPYLKAHCHSGKVSMRKFSTLTMIFSEHFLSVEMFLKWKWTLNLEGEHIFERGEGRLILLKIMKISVHTG